jgi:hypothetical protein
MLTRVSWPCMHGRHALKQSHTELHHALDCNRMCSQPKHAPATWCQPFTHMRSDQAHVADAFDATLQAKELEQLPAYGNFAPCRNTHNVPDPVANHRKRMQRWRPVIRANPHLPHHTDLPQVKYQRQYDLRLNVICEAGMSV